MTIDITPEMTVAWRTLTRGAELIDKFINPSVFERDLAAAIGVLKDSGLMDALMPPATERGAGEGVVYGRLPNNPPGPSVAEVILGNVPR